MTTLVRPRNFALATDWSVVSPRFAPGLSTTHGGAPTGGPDVSPDQIFPGWRSPVRSVRHAIWIAPSAMAPKLMGTRPDLHRQATTSLSLSDQLSGITSNYWTHEEPGLEVVAAASP